VLSFEPRCHGDLGSVTAETPPAKTYLTASTRVRSLLDSPRRQREMIMVWRYPQRMGRQIHNFTQLWTTHRLVLAPYKRANGGFHDDFHYHSARAGAEGRVRLLHLGVKSRSNQPSRNSSSPFELLPLTSSGTVGTRHDPRSRMCRLLTASREPPIDIRSLTRGTTRLIRVSHGHSRSSESEPLDARNRRSQGL